MENLIREAKDGFGIDEFSGRSWNGNYADLLIKLLAYNLTLAFQQDLCSLRGAPLQTIRLLRRWTLHVPAILVRHARDGRCASPASTAAMANSSACDDDFKPSRVDLVQFRTAKPQGSGPFRTAPPASGEHFCPIAGPLCSLIADPSDPNAL